ncbi:MAG TPA: hypothetical protein VFT58_05170, partial [Nitrososphaera sp.]|nr:hypothetical protein [Nitrososphaera sp.]
VAGDEVIAEGSADVMYVRNDYLTAIPEPSANILALVAVVAVASTLERLSRRCSGISGVS